MSRKARDMQRELRRETVAVNLLNGMTYRQIAEGLEVDPATVARDVAEIKERWQAEHVHKIEALIAMESARLDTALVAIMPKVREGNLYAIDRMLAVLDRRIRLYGLDAKALLEHVKELLLKDDAGTRPVSIAEGVRALEELLKSARGEGGEEAADRPVPTVN